MTNLHLAASTDNDDKSSSLADREIHLDLRTELRSCTPNESDSGTPDETGPSYSEPLGYQHFLYNVDIEYSPGGNKAYAPGNKHGFKLKYLPYMVPMNEQKSRRLSNVSSNSGIPSPQNSDDSPDSTIPLLDVASTTCAFLGNSEYVPKRKLEERRVILELISAKLSQSTTYNIPVNLSHSSLVSLAEMSSTQDTSFHPETSSQISRDSTEARTNGLVFLTSPQSPQTSSPVSSKRYVNYTILIKTIPGLDKHPAVIERRFSDFLLLYKNLKATNSYSMLIEKHVSFPKKVYMGNFSLSNITERSVEFSRLLDLCMTENTLLWSIPFVSFLIDKEIKEAHKLSLCGDPDDVQALVETAYFILRKLYLTPMFGCLDDESQVLMDLESGQSVNRYSQSLPNRGASTTHSPGNEMISAENSYSNSQRTRSSELTDCSSPNLSTSDTSEPSDTVKTLSKLGLKPLNQRILVTFCMLFIAYYRGENYQDLKVAVRDFSQLIASQEYVETLVTTRHYSTLRACLLFLMNINKGDIIDDESRVWLKRRLEDIDVIQSEADQLVGQSMGSNNNDRSEIFAPSPSGTTRRSTSQEEHSGRSTSGLRVTKGDLTSLLRDRNFCSF